MEENKINPEHKLKLKGCLEYILNWQNCRVMTFGDEKYNHLEYFQDNVGFVFFDSDYLKKDNDGLFERLIQDGFPVSFDPKFKRYHQNWYDSWFDNLLLEDDYSGPKIKIKCEEGQQFMTWRNSRLKSFENSRLNYVEFFTFSGKLLKFSDRQAESFMWQNDYPFTYEPEVGRLINQESLSHAFENCLKKLSTEEIMDQLLGD